MYVSSKYIPYNCMHEKVAKLVLICGINSVCSVMSSRSIKYDLYLGYNIEKNI